MFRSFNALQRERRARPSLSMLVPTRLTRERRVVIPVVIREVVFLFGIFPVRSSISFAFIAGEVTASRKKENLKRIPAF